MSDLLIKGIVRILGREHQTAGTGFVISNDGFMVTCAHVIRIAKAGPGDIIDLVFHNTGEQRRATVEREYWRDGNAEDIAFLRLQGDLPTTVRPLPLGSSLHTHDHSFRTFGFPSINSIEGMWGSGEVLGPKQQGGFPALQIRSQEVTLGCSGAPIWDVSAQHVIGMVSSSTVNREVNPGRQGQTFTIPHDPNWRFLFTAFATPTETLRRACPMLQVSECPYRQLFAFSEADAPFFFGRDAFVERLVEHLRGNPHFLAVFGPSGSGKSSVVQAGLVPQLRKGVILGSERWEIIITRPSDDPFRLLPQQHSNENGLCEKIQLWLKQYPEETNRVVLVLDQFEEALVAEEAIRNAFITQLTALLDISRKITLIIIMRDDFYSQLVGQEALRRKLDENKSIVNVPQTLTQRDLKAIICEPAKRAHVQIQEGPADLIIRDAMEGKQEARSTILPLLEFTLTRLWEKRQQETLTVEEYNTMHGIAGEFISWANIAYDSLVEELPLAQRHLVQRIFTDLVHLGDESQQQPNSRQRKLLAALCRTESESRFVEYIVQQLVQRRLLVRNGETVEIIHDVLLNEWSYLKNWIKENRTYLEWHQRLKEKFQDWEKSKAEHSRKRDAHKLLAGSDLAQATSYLKQYKNDLTMQDQFFIDASQKRQRREVNKSRATMLVLVVLSILATGLAQWAWLNLQQVQAEKRVALAHALAAQANAYLLKHQFDLAMLLSVKAYQMEDDYDTRDGLLTVLEGSSQVDKVLHEANFLSNFSQSSIIDFAFSDDGQTLVAVRADREVVLWNTVTGEQHSLHISAPGGRFKDIALSPHGKIVIASMSDGLMLWDTQTNRQLLRLSGSLAFQNRVIGESSRFTFSPDERMLSIDDGQGNLVLWDVAAGKTIGALLTGLADQKLGRVAFSTDDKFLAVSVCGDDDFTIANGGYPIYCGQSDIVLWDVASRTRIGNPLRSSQFGIRSIAFSPDGHLLATGGTNSPYSPDRDSTVVLWDIASQQPLGVPLLGHTGWVESVAFSHDGKLLASGSDDQTVRLWDVAARKEVGEPFLGHQDSVTAVTFSLDDRYLVSSSADNTTIIWNIASKSHLSQPLNLEIGGFRGSISSSPFADSFAYIENGGIYLLNVKTGTRTTLLPPSSQIGTGGITLGSNLQMLVAHNQDGTITLWSIMTREPIKHFKDPFLQDRDIALSSDGQMLVTCCDASGKTITVWDVATGHVVRRINSAEDVFSIAISPDGKMIASGGSSGTVTLWSVTTGSGQPLAEHMKDVSAELFSPDGKILAARSSAGTLLLWNTVEQKFLDAPPLVNDPSLASPAMAFSPDGGILALASGPLGSAITLWDVNKQEFVAHALSGSPIDGLIFGLHGQLLSTTDRGHGVPMLSFTLWDVNLASWIEQACSIANRNLTITEWGQFVGGEPYSKICPNYPLIGQ